jgi:hypothetical protein
VLEQPRRQGRRLRLRRHRLRPRSQKVTWHAAVSIVSRITLYVCAMYGCAIIVVHLENALSSCYVSSLRFTSQVLNWP